MQLPEIAIRNHQFTWIAFLLLIILGIVSYFTMPRSEDPQFKFSAAMILIVDPGTTPTDIEKLIVDPIESEINELDDLSEIKTNIEDGMATIRVEFLYGTDPDDKYDDVVGAVSKVRDQLPSSIAQLKIEQISPIDVTSWQLALTSEQAGYLELKKHAEALEKKLERVSGVKKVDIDALPQMEVQIQVEQRKASAMGISLAEIAQAVEAGAKNIPGGHVHADGRRFTVRTSGDFESLDAIASTVIRAHNGRIIYLRDLAHVTQTEGLPSYKARYNGTTAVFLSVIQRPGTQIFRVKEQLDEALADYQPLLPEYIQLQMVMDQALSVEHQIDGFFTSLKQGLVLVAIMALLVLGFRPALVVVLAIPISIFIAIGWVDIADFGLQQMSIVGLIIALGMLVDNAIVVVENVGRHLRNGATPQQAAIDGANQVGWAVASGTLTTVLAFLPLIMMQNGPGTFLRAMPVTVVLTLFASLLVALSLTPLLASRLGGFDSTPYLQRKLQTVADGTYLKLLSKALNRPKTVLSIAMLTLAAALALFPFIGVSLFPKAEKPMLFVNIEMPEGSSYSQTDLMAKKVEELVKEYDLVEDIAANIGRGNPRIFYNTMPSRQTVNLAQLFVTLKTGELPVVEPFITELRAQLNQVQGAQVTVKELMQGPPVAAPVEVRIMGESLAQLQQVAGDVEAIMQKTAGLVGVENPAGKNKVDLRVEINRDKAALLGIPLTVIDHSIRTALVGSPMGLYRDDDGDEYPLMLRLSEYAEPQLQTFADIQLPTASGKLVPLMQLASIAPVEGIARFQHYDTARMTPVTADVAPGFNTEKVTNQVVEQLATYAWPQGVYYQVGGEQASRKEAFGGMAKATLIAVLGIFAVLVLEFRSLVQPLIVFAAIPFAVTGAFLGLFISGYTFSFTAFIGMTSLVGIVVNNSIILVDYANVMRRDGMEKYAALKASAQTRFIPIVLTTFTTIGGLIPITFSGSSMWAPLGWVIMGGLLVSTLLTLIVVPVLYSYLGKMAEE